jgi:hypothetical protein
VSSTNYLVVQPGPICAGPAPPTPHLAWAVYNGAVLSGLLPGNQAALQIDSMGNLLVNVAVGGGGGGGTVAQGAQGLITSPWFVELSDGTNPLGTGTNPLRIDPVGTTVQPVDGTVTAEIVGHAGAILDGTAGSPSTGVLTVQGVTGGTPVPVSIGGAASTIPVTINGQANGNNGLVVPQLVKTDPTTNDLLLTLIAEMRAVRIILTALATEVGDAKDEDFDPYRLEDPTQFTNVDGA